MGAKSNFCEAAIFIILAQQSKSRRGLCQTDSKGGTSGTNSINPKDDDDCYYEYDGCFSISIFVTCYSCSAPFSGSV